MLESEYGRSCLSANGRMLIEAVSCRDAVIMTQFRGDDNRGKISMKELFGRKNITKDGKEGKVGPLQICLNSLFR